MDTPKIIIPLDRYNELIEKEKLFENRLSEILYVHEYTGYDNYKDTFIVDSTPEVIDKIEKEIEEWLNDFFSRDEYYLKFVEQHYPRREPPMNKFLSWIKFYNLMKRKDRKNIKKIV